MVEDTSVASIGVEVTRVLTIIEVAMMAAMWGVGTYGLTTGMDIRITRTYVMPLTTATTGLHTRATEEHQGWSRYRLRSMRCERVIYNFLFERKDPSSAIRTSRLRVRAPVLKNNCLSVAFTESSDTPIFAAISLLMSPSNTPWST